MENWIGSFLWTSFTILAGLAVFVVLAMAVSSIYFAWLCRWADEQTRDSKYYARSLEDRRRFKATLARRTMLLRPFLWLLSRVARVHLEQASFEYEGIWGPKGSCSVERFREASQYSPTEQDIFVVTQMKCGTTWMQYLVHQLLSGGDAHLVDSGKALYAVSPWIEGTRSVRLSEAPLIGTERPSRIIKTHLPVSLCPFSSKAKYIYVVRHPVSCFASIVDFLRRDLGPFQVPLQDFEDWFCSNKMWWGPWPAHFAGWWERSQAHHNVMLVSFEEMSCQLEATVSRVAQFLGVGVPDSSTLTTIIEQCSFEAMKRHSEAFEMNVPTVLSTSGAAFVSGAVDRYKNVPEATRGRILTWCRAALHDKSHLLTALWGDLEKG